MYIYIICTHCFTCVDELMYHMYTYVSVYICLKYFMIICVKLHVYTLKYMCMFICFCIHVCMCACWYVCMLVILSVYIYNTYYTPLSISIYITVISIIICCH